MIIFPKHFIIKHRHQYYHYCCCSKSTDITVQVYLGDRHNGQARQKCVLNDDENCGLVV